MKRLLSVLIIAVILCSSLAFADSYEDMLAKAQAYRLSGDYEHAEACYDLAQRIDGQRTDAFLGAVELMFEQGKSAEAEAYLDTVFSIDPVNATAWVLKCRIDVATGDTVAFTLDALYAEVCEADLNPYAADIAVMFSQAGQYNDAVEYFSKAESLTDDQQELYRRSLVATGQRDKAAELGLMKEAARNTLLDAAFASDNLVLKKIELPGIRIDDFEFPDDLWETMETEKPEDPYKELAAAIEDSEKALFSISPTGNSGFYAVGNTLVSSYNGKYHILYPSAKVGVADEYENLKFYHQSMISSYRALGEEGIVYSPDGRYAAIYNVRYLSTARYFQDPIIIDLSTGGMILTQTYSSNYSDDNVGAVVTALFSMDGRYFYYILYGKTTDDRDALYRYDLKTGDTELCCSIPYLIDMPQMYETAIGSILIMEDSIKMSDTIGIIEIDYKDGNWSVHKHSFDMERTYWHPRTIKYSNNSGYAFCVGDFATSQLYSAFMALQPDEEWTGLNEYHAIYREFEDIVDLDKDDYVNSMTESIKEGDKLNIHDIPYASIQKAVISPDGFYALLLTNNGNGDAHLYLLSLERLQIVDVKGIDASKIPLGSLSMKYSPIIEWNTDTLIIYDGEGINAYQFDY